MTITEASKLLTIASTYDGRVVTPEASATWAQALHGVSFEDGAAGIAEHYRTSTDWLMPNHVIVMARKVARDRDRLERRALPRAQTQRLDPEATHRHAENVRRILKGVTQPE